jgi:hypothetical protein
MSEIENIDDRDADRLAVLENLAAELEQRLLTVMHPEGGAHLNVAVPRAVPKGRERAAGAVKGGGSRGGSPAAGGRTEALINQGRPGSRRSRRRPGRRRLLGRWRLTAAGAVALLAGVVAALVATRGSGASWPASVAAVQAEIRQACANPDVAAEPSGLNFACAKDTDQVLWVFALLTSGDNPNFVDQSTGRKGLEPVQLEQGGDIAWSLNLHHPYDPASPIDSLAVAARAINNIISGATLTSSTGSALIEPGLESKPANCQRYTGSAKLATRPGFPAACASPVTGASGQAALVSDVFKQWMGGTPSRIASEAGVLFENAGNPGNPQVRAVLASLPASGG